MGYESQRGVDYLNMVNYSYIYVCLRLGKLLLMYLLLGKRLLRIKAFIINMIGKKLQTQELQINS